MRRGRWPTHAMARPLLGSGPADEVNDSPSWWNQQQGAQGQQQQIQGQQQQTQGQRQNTIALIFVYIINLCVCVLSVSISQA